MNEVGFSTSFTQRYTFAGPPDRDLRRKLLAAGFKFDGIGWSRTLGSADALSPSHARFQIEQDIWDQREFGVTPADWQASA